VTTLADAQTGEDVELTLGEGVDTSAAVEPKGAEVKGAEPQGAALQSAASHTVDPESTEPQSSALHTTDLQGTEPGTVMVQGAEPRAAEPEIVVMTVVEHLDELRRRLIRCILYIGLSFIGALCVTKEILRALEKPAGDIQFQALSLEEPVIVFFKVAFYTGVALASPLVLFEISRFISPGLTKVERRILTPIVVGSPALFLAGVAFAYFCLLPPMLHFFGSFGQGVTPINQRLDFYVSLVSSILLYMGLCFQLPIILFALSFTGLVTSRQLVSVWKYALVGVTLVAAVITPDPTAFSMILVMLALMTLYFLSVVLLKLFGR
jgi:sec-independent protein translocase protein TatC